MNLRKGLFRFTLVVSILIGTWVSLKTYNEQVYSAKPSLAEQVALHSREWKWNKNLPTEPKDRELRIAEIWLEDDDERKEFENLKKQTLENLTDLDVIKNKPIIFLNVTKRFLLGFVPVWIIYYLLYFIIRGFTVKEK